MRGIYIYLIALSACSALGVDHYFTQSGAGAQDGSSLGNAWSLANVNNAANWGVGAGKITAGDTLHVSGIVTNALTAQGSGTAGNPITILWDTGAKFSAGVIAVNTAFVHLGSQSYITVDGGANGMIELTNNGTTSGNGGTFGNGTGNIEAITGSASKGLTFQNLTIANFYVRQNNTDPGPTPNGNGLAGVFLSDCSQLMFSNCTIHDVQNAISLTYSSAHQSNYVFTANHLSNYVWGISIAADSSGALLDNIIITNNSLRTGDTWQLNNNLHRDTIYLRDDVGSIGNRMSNIVIAANFVKAGESPDPSASGGTGGGSFSLNSQTNAVHVRIYNNYCVLASPLTYSSGGEGHLSGNGIDVVVANNTLIGWTNASLSSAYGGGIAFSLLGSNVFAFNNLILSSGGVKVGTTVDTAGFSGPPYYPLYCYAFGLSKVLSDYNVFNYGNGNNQWLSLMYSNAYNALYTPEGILNSLAQWKANLTNQEMHSVTTTASLDANFVPTLADTVARGNGTNLTAFGIPAVDYFGNARPTTGNWTIGAFENTSPGGTPTSTADQTGGMSTR